MIEKKVSPIIGRDETGRPQKVVGVSVEYRLLSLLVFKKIIYLPARYDVRSVNDVELEKWVLSTLLNK